MIINLTFDYDCKQFNIHMINPMQLGGPFTIFLVIFVFIDSIHTPIL
jgi:hypothetical protein